MPPKKTCLAKKSTRKDQRKVIGYESPGTKNRRSIHAALFYQTHFFWGVFTSIFYRQED